MIIIDTTTPRNAPTSNKDPLELPQGPITRVRAKQFKEAISAIVNQVWGEALAGQIERAWTSSTRTPCNLLQVDLSSHSAPRAAFSLT
ncbi:hypothetical protein PVK06_049002 [Gossypium arboreum]|uniref:Uncharacterized protein n=1 Tax=Gossypium arboreum TaxID=29729 RepID=A0ABR0MHI2_GOSAR|nr:hypothetical protein PVK06_049002 [Gossypium arboreum]